jgi:hypothetical protein
MSNRMSPRVDFTPTFAGLPASTVNARTQVDLGEWARAVFQWWKSQRAKDEKKSEEAFSEAAGISRQGFRHITDGRRKNPHMETVRKINTLAPPHLKRFDFAQPPGSTKLSDPSARLASIRRHLGEALERRADKFTGPQALAIRSEIDDLSARVGTGEIDTAEADIIVDLLARIVGPGGRGDRR